MRRRPAARLLVLDPCGRVLLFRFTHPDRPSGEATYWATPGGSLEAGEDFRSAALRELQEETGINGVELSDEVCCREFPLQLNDGELVLAEERYFAVRVSSPRLLFTNWTASEVNVITDHRWWSIAALMATTETVWPDGLVNLLVSVHANGPDR